MTEYDASPQQTPLPRPPGHDHSSPSTSRDIQDRHVTPGSPETGESSRSGSLMNSSWTTDPALAHRRSQDDPLAHEDPSEHRHERDTRESRRSSHHHRSHKHKSTGAFLLSDPFGETGTDDTRGRKQGARRTVDKGKGTSKRHNHEQTQSTRQPSAGLGLPPDLRKTPNSSAGQPPGTPPRTTATERKQGGLLPNSPGMPSPQSSPSSVDLDSTQIVSMALNLSESRRLIQSRAVSQPIPPRLAPLPTDNSVAGTLRHQLQQQRRASRTVSPRPERGAGQRVVSNGKQHGSLQPPFEPMGSEGSYRYNFSNSTLARAQKTKDYMELLAQYRRVIDLLPPLKPNSLSKVSTGESQPLSMPMSLDTINATGQIGRQYDPLQYIRNRKVRARERKTIDGESQGFGDVNRVTDWVDEVAKWVATRQMRTPGSSTLPPFSGADMFSMENSPPTHIPRPAVGKAKRPRNDWIIEPADLLADIYWLEQDDHKRLVEDRNWRRVFPQHSDLYRPLSRATDEASPGVASTSSAQHSAAEVDYGPWKATGDSKAQKSDNEPPPSSTREKARQKLQGLRGFHRHNNTLRDDKHSHSRLRGRRDSTSSSSSSDSEKRSRRGTSGDTDKDILEKQMMEMVAQEAREAKEDETRFSLREPDLKQLKTRPSNIAAPPQSSTPNSAAASRQHSRRQSRIDVSDVDDKNAAPLSRLQSPQRPSRESLDVPPFRGRRMSIGSDSSVPNSPDFRASRRDNYFMPGIGADLSPSPSRPGSPSRNPLSRVKQIFRDRSRDRAGERHHEALSNEKEGFADAALKATSRLTSTPDLAPENPASQSRNSSIGPEVKLASRTTADSHKSHRKTNSLRLGDSGAGLRSLFKGPRIDSVLKSGVSKVSELLWKKDSEAEESDSSTSLSDDSDAESRGRRKNTRLLSPASSIRGRPGQAKQERHHLDVTPPFVPASEQGGNHSLSGSMGVPLSRPTSHRSTRFDLLKPPRIDISAAADSSADTKEAYGSDSDKRLGSIQKGIKDGNRRPSLSIQPPSSRRVSAESVRSSRHFSITEKDLAPERAPISRREVARLRAMVLSSGVMAMEISRRAHRPTNFTANTANENNDILAALGNKVSWPDVVQLAPEDERTQLLANPISQADLFPYTARVLGTAIQTSRQRWQSEAESFTHRTRVELIDGRIETLRARIQLDLTAMTRAAAEEADEVSGDLVDGQRRKVKAVVDVIDKLLRRRRRRFRWVRRAGWLALEWLLVGFMWYVWFVVMIARIFLGVGKGFVRGVRWLLWL